MIGRDGSLGKVLDLLPDDRDASFVRRVQFEYTRAVQLWSKQLLAQSEDRRSLSCPGRSVEEHVRELVRGGGDALEKELARGRARLTG